MLKLSAGNLRSTSTSRIRLSDPYVGAFSGEVNDKESGPEPFKETTPELNPNLKSNDFREEFNRDYQILLVANKFQTGFDQPPVVWHGR